MNDIIDIIKKRFVAAKMSLQEKLSLQGAELAFATAGRMGVAKKDAASWWRTTTGMGKVGSVDQPRTDT